MSVEVWVSEVVVDTVTDDAAVVGTLSVVVRVIVLCTVD